jgi:hypothetical protein
MFKVAIVVMVFALECLFLTHAAMGADLSHVKGLTQKQSHEACGDAGTRLPQGLIVKTCS